MGIQFHLIIAGNSIQTSFFDFESNHTSSRLVSPLKPLQQLGLSSYDGFICKFDRLPSRVVAFFAFYLFLNPFSPRPPVFSPPVGEFRKKKNPSLFLGYPHLNFKIPIPASIMIQERSTAEPRLARKPQAVSADLPLL